MRSGAAGVGVSCDFPRGRMGEGVARCQIRKANEIINAEGGIYLTTVKESCLATDSNKAKQARRLCRTPGLTYSSAHSFSRRI